LKIIAHRDDVHAGDDPRPLEFTLADGAGPRDALEFIVDSHWLPSITGGKATWSVVATAPIAIVAQEWTQPKFLPFQEEIWADARRVGDALKLHFNYHAQIPPDVVHRVFWGAKLRA
jgi:hypothetical protein